MDNSAASSAPDHASGDREGFADILRGEAEKCGLTLADMRGPNKARRFAFARFAAWYRGALLGYSTPFMGRLTGKRHHTTVLNGIRRYATINGLPQISWRADK